MRDKIINFRYVFYPFLAFFFGITMTRKLFAGNLETILLVVGLFAILTGFLVWKRSYKILALLFVFFFVGNGFYYLGETSYYGKEYSSKVSVVGRITDDIVDYGYTMQVVIDNVKIDGNSEENLRLTIKNPSTSIKAGDKIAFEGYVERSRPFTLNSFNSSDNRDSVRYRAEVNFNNVVITDGYLKFDEKVRLAVKNALYENMSEKNAGISYAVLFGDKTGVDELTENAYISSGIIHVLTVSGLHVGFLISLVYFLLKLCKANKIIRFVVTTIFIFFYAYLCGFAPSVLRAGIMAIVLMLSKLFMRRYDSLNSLGIAGFAICLFSPLTALDIGFQMSFFCVAGIIILSPTITKFLSRFIPYKIASLIALTISAQIGILPITATFGATVNILSIFANLIVVPMFSIIYPVLFLISFLATFLPFIGKLLVIIDYALIAVNAIANFFGSSNLSFNTSPFKTAIVSLYFITIMAIGKFVMTKSVVKFAVFSILALVMTVTFGLFLIPAPKSNSITFVGNKTSASVILENTQGRRLVVGESYMLSRYLSAYSLDYVDGFVALDYLGNEDMEEMIDEGIQTFMGNAENENNPNFVTLEEDTAHSFGGYKIKFVTGGGVQITFDEIDIFVATNDEIDYNNLVLEDFSPDIVFSKSGSGECDYICATQLAGDGDYNLSKNGNMKFVFNGEKIIMRGID